MKAKFMAVAARTLPTHTCTHAHKHTNTHDLAVKWSSGYLVHAVTI